MTSSKSHGIFHEMSKRVCTKATLICASASSVSIKISMYSSFYLGIFRDSSFSEKVCRYLIYIVVLVAQVCYAKHRGKKKQQPQKLSNKDLT